MTTDWKIGVRSPAEVKHFSSILCVRTGSEADPASCTMGTGGPWDLQNSMVKLGQVVVMVTINFKFRVFWDVLRSSQMLTDVSEVRTVSIIALIMEAVRTSETLVNNYSGVCYNERMLQRTAFINKIRMLQRKQILQRTRRTLKRCSLAGINCPNL
jgi:hypothetical protein